MNLTRKRKRILLIIMGTVVIVALGMVILFKNSHPDWRVDKSGHPVTVMKKGVNISPVVNTNKEFSQVIKKNYPNLAKSNILAGDQYDVVVPGLLKTSSLKSNTKKTIGTSTQMDPQGLAITDKYIIISAYSRGKEYNSVLYFLDKKTGKYLKHFVLPGTPHAGGIAYDKVNGRLWITTETPEHRAEISSLTKADLEKPDFSKTKKAVQYELQIALPEIRLASFIGYQTGQLDIGYFDEFNHGKVLRVNINQAGIPDLTTKTASRMLDNNGNEHIYNVRHVKSYPTVKKLQGITFYQNHVLFSQSYGDQSSALLDFDENSTKVDFQDNHLIEKIAFPPYLEQIVADGDHLYVLFESGAKYFRTRDLSVVGDHILKLNLKTLLKDK